MGSQVFFDLRRVRGATLFNFTLPDAIET